MDSERRALFGGPGTASPARKPTLSVLGPTGTVTLCQSFNGLPTAPGGRTLGREPLDSLPEEAEGPVEGPAARSAPAHTDPDICRDILGCSIGAPSTPESLTVGAGLAAAGRLFAYTWI
jgi:hypothetical protein